jgi:hypothetical protein
MWNIKRASELSPQKQLPSNPAMTVPGNVLIFCYGALGDPSAHLTRL